MAFDDPEAKMAMAALPELLELDEVDQHRYRVVQPSESAEGRDVVFGGQLLAQMIMASDKAGGSAKDVKSIHAIFARAGTYTLPIELEVESMQSGRTWASDTVTAWQDGRMLSRALVLMSIDDPDIIRHELAMPEVPGPEGASTSSGSIYPGAEMITVGDPGSNGPGGVPAMYFWHRHANSYESPAVNQAILSWATDGLLIGLAIEPHQDVLKISDAHRTVSTGVIGHTVNFHERFDVGQWLLFAHEATYAGRGRVHGRGLVFTEDGRLVATFNQDSMVRGIEGNLDPRRSM
ncbi:MAG TPA: acyl-CoA thioesterase domain-containing protein [Acidimicrobiales bacterium]|nr:acyl-CoA thioesterase domain-containing protein [Acidimicrobiales bacterium]